MRKTLGILIPLLFLSASLASSASAQETLFAPRVMYWWGKVNQHFDLASGTWVSDPDGTSGADLDMLGYCRRWYPGTAAVRPFATETSTTWRAAGGVGPYTSTQPSYECVQEFVPRIMFWWGKVNQHVDPVSRTWVSDPDGTSGADLDRLAYCRRWYPATRAVVPYARETISTWRAAGGTGAFTSTETSYWCMP